jgi:hypothetical protein
MLGSANNPGAYRDSGQRSFGRWGSSEHQPPGPAIFEWRETELDENDIAQYLSMVRDLVPTERGDGLMRLNKIQTFKYLTNITNGRYSAIVYKCARSSINLSEAFDTIPKPSTSERIAIALGVAKAIRSLHVDCKLMHPSLRTESFVYVKEDDGNINLNCPFVLDWARRPRATSFYTDPRVGAVRLNELTWYNDIWALLVVISEILEWQKLDGNSFAARGLKDAQREWKNRVKSAGWNGEAIANFFTYGLDRISQQSRFLDVVSEREITRYFNKLCDLLDDL